MLVLFCYFILSWFPLQPGGIMFQIRDVLDRFFSPIFTYMRRYIPPIGRMDISGLVLIFGLYIVQSILANFS